MMDDLIVYIKTRLEEIKETYDFYLTKLDMSYSEAEQKTYENRLRDLRIEKNTLEDILEKIEGED